MRTPFFTAAMVMSDCAEQIHYLGQAKTVGLRSTEVPDYRIYFIWQNNPCLPRLSVYRGFRFIEKSDYAGSTVYIYIQRTTTCSSQPTQVAYLTIL